MKGFRTFSVKTVAVPLKTVEQGVIKDVCITDHIPGMRELNTIKKELDLSVLFVDTEHIETSITKYKVALEDIMSIGKVIEKTIVSENEEE